jgi:hypothetical protein
MEGGCRKLHIEELQNLYCSPSVIRIIRIGFARNLAHMSEGKRPLGTPSCGQEDNIKMDREKELSGLDWLGLALGRDQ